jgi:hypothetical protein
MLRRGPEKAARRKAVLHNLWRLVCTAEEHTHWAQCRMRFEENPLLLGLALLLVVAWILGFVVFHVAGGLIHLLIIIAVISAIVHFVRGARTA